MGSYFKNFARDARPKKKKNELWGVAGSLSLLPYLIDRKGPGTNFFILGAYGLEDRAGSRLHVGDGLGLVLVRTDHPVLGAY